MPEQKLRPSTTVMQAVVSIRARDELTREASLMADVLEGIADEMAACLAEECEVDVYGAQYPDRPTIVVDVKGVYHVMWTAALGLAREILGRAVIVDKQGLFASVDEIVEVQL